MEGSTSRLSAEEVERFLISDPRIAIRISRLLGEQVARLEERLTDLALRPVDARVASTLLNLAGATPAGRFGQNHPIRLTHEQIAGLLGATREATSKTLAEFAAQASSGKAAAASPSRTPPRLGLRPATHHDLR